MKVTIFIGAEHAYAAIKGDTFSLDVALNPGRSAAQSLRESAAHDRARADRLLTLADRQEQAAAVLELDQ